MHQTPKATLRTPKFRENRREGEAGGAKDKGQGREEEEEGFPGWEQLCVHRQEIKTLLLPEKIEASLNISERREVTGSYGEAS